MAHKFTDADRKKAVETRKQNAANNLWGVDPESLDSLLKAYGQRDEAEWAEMLLARLTLIGVGSIKADPMEVRAIQSILPYLLPKLRARDENAGFDPAQARNLYEESLEEESTDGTG